MEKYRTTLPAGYREVDVIDIKNDKRVRVWGDILSVLLMAATAGVGCFAVPLAELIHFDYTDMADCRGSGRGRCDRADLSAGRGRHALVRGGKDEFRHYQRVGLYGGL